MDSLKPLAASCQVFLHVDCKPLCIRANLQQMKELFTNLATNAIKYNRPGGQVWITVGEQGDDMLVRVKDNGVGIQRKAWTAYSSGSTGWIRAAAANRAVRGWGCPL